MIACGPGRHSAGSDETCSDATCSSGDAGPRRTSLAGMNRTDEGTSDWPSSPDGKPGGSRRVKTSQSNRSPSASARAIGGQSRAVSFCDWVDGSSTNVSGWPMSWRFAAARLALPRKEHKVDDQVPQDGHHACRGPDSLRTRPTFSCAVWPRETLSTPRVEPGINGLRSWGRNLSRVVEIAFDPLTQHEAVVAGEAAGVVAGPENQVVSLGDHRSIPRTFSLLFFKCEDIIQLLTWRSVDSDPGDLDHHARKPVSCSDSRHDQLQKWQPRWVFWVRPGYAG